MSITTAMCVSAKLGVMTRDLDISATSAQVFRMALYTEDASLDAYTAAYTTDNEVADGGGYLAGGEIATLNGGPTTSGLEAYIDFDNVTWTGATITARGCVIYEVSTQISLMTLDFGENKTVSGGNYTVNIPAPAAGTAIFRFT